MSRRFAVNAPAVISEVIDGEAVIMNLQIGHYYSTRGPGAAAWQALERGHPETDVAAALARAYGVDAGEANASLASFIDGLLAHELVREGAAADPDAPPVLAVAPGTAWSAPALDVYTDMEDLLLLDPIHDVGVAGWPMPKPDAVA